VVREKLNSILAEYDFYFHPDKDVSTHGRLLSPGPEASTIVKNLPKM